MSSVNGRPTKDDRAKVLASWFEDGGVLVADSHFILSQRTIRQIRQQLKEVGLNRSKDQIKTIHAQAAELLVGDASIKCGLKELRLAGQIGNINQYHPCLRAIYARVDEKTAQQIMDGDIRRAGWHRHALDQLAEEVPSRPSEIQPNLSPYAAQAWRQMAIVQDLPRQLTEPTPLLIAEKDNVVDES